MKNNMALLIIDVQNDFCPGGALAVPDGDRVVEPLRRTAEFFASSGLPVLASRDWHPPVSRHFKEFGGIWPIHCVQYSTGAEFHSGLHLPEGTIVVSKGVDPDADAYSAFAGCDDLGASLEEILTRLHVQHLIVGGLATDYCVKYSVLDALKTGFAVTVLSDAIAGVNVSAGDSTNALQQMKHAGATFCSTHEVGEL